MTHLAVAWSRAATSKVFGVVGDVPQVELSLCLRKRDLGLLRPEGGQLEAESLDLVHVEAAWITLECVSEIGVTTVVRTSLGSG